MLLKNRIALVVFLLLLLVQVVCGLLVWQWNRATEARYHQSLLSRQSLAWSKVQAEAVGKLASVADTLAASPEVTRALHGNRFDTPAFAAKVTQVLRDAGNPRLDIQSNSLSMLYTTDNSLSQERVLEVGWSRTIRDSQKALSGLAQLANHHYMWVYTKSFDRDAGLVTVALDAKSKLEEFAQHIGGGAFIVSSRGREVIGTRPGLMAKLNAALPSSEETVQRAELDGHHYLVVSQPLHDPSRRRIGLLIGVVDATDEAISAQRLNLYLLGAAILSFGLANAVFWLFLRHAFAPLNNVIAVLTRLAQGDIDAQPDDDATQDQEVMQASAGVLALRRDVLNLQMLREEQARASQQQELLIRNQLRQLAESLDPESRSEVLNELEASASSDGPEDPLREDADNQLAKLAGILGRMSGLVTTQQARLLKLLKELQEAMETQAQFMSLQQELEIARSIQQSILPRLTLGVKAVEVAATMLPAKEVGGDFYDYFQIDERRVGVVVADVSGKGIPAAFFMAISRTLLKSSALFFGEPDKAIRRLNDQLCADNEQMMFVTVFFGVLDIQTGDFRYVNAGHNPPVWVSRNGEARYLGRSSNMALAVLEEQDFTEGHLVLEKGDSLFLFTDGVTEATNPEQQLFGDAALLTCLGEEHLAPKPLLDKVVARVRAFSRDEPQSDDITCVALRFGGNA